MDVEIEHPHHHHKTGHRWLDMLLPLSALLISIVSIGIAVHHGKVMESLVQQNERLVQANSLPYVELGYNTGTEEGAPRISMLALNSGMGPAQLRSVQIKVDGRPVTLPRELYAACCGGHENIRTSTSTLLNRMIQAGQSMRYIDVSGAAATTPFAKKFAKAIADERIVTTICFCSVFDECWINSSRARALPKRVEACPMPEPQYRY